MFFFRPAPVYEYVSSRRDTRLIRPPLPEIDYQQRIRRFTPGNNSRISKFAFLSKKDLPFSLKKLVDSVKNIKKKPTNFTPTVQ